MWGWDPASRENLKKTEIIFCGDMTYDLQVVEQFVGFVEQLFEFADAADLVVLLAVEKRLNFVVQHMKVQDQGFDFLVNYFDSSSKYTRRELQVSQMLDYDRSEFVELWKINCVEA
eukprot:TRINITY_DN20288_c2_g1_i1.p3 TRINITY_DN20288_c2_g1~~TRINITY_DN20288_c2_g1_i1.p3  ORF type:complete len:116 (-),score=23.43 TRINITY_DN20288_c2_g1_i1:109-456(-)